MTRVLLVRHAAFDGVGSVLAGRSAVRLNEHGRAQAAELGRALAGEPVHAVCSSPRERALETARAIAAVHGLDVTSDDAFDELDLGAWTGRSIAELDGDPHWVAFNTSRDVTRIPDGELLLEVQARAVAGLHRLCGAHPQGATLVVVSHGDVIRALVALLLGMPLDAMLRFTIDPASVSTVVLGNGAPHVLGINRSHA